MGFSFSDAQIPGLTISSILYGINLVMLYYSLKRLFGERDGSKRSWRDINFLMATIVVFLFMSGTAGLGLQLTLVMRSHTDLVQSRPEDFWYERRTFIGPKAGLMILEMLIVDSVLLFRCWMVWNKMLLAVVLPLLLWAGCFASSSYAMHSLHDWMTPSVPSVGRSTYFSMLAFWVCTMAVNIYCTVMIVRKICSVQQAWTPPSICSLRDIPQRGRMQLAKRIVIESAMLYTMASLAAFINHLCGSPGTDIACQALIQITGIAFNLMLIRPSTAEQDYRSDPSVVCCKPETSHYSTNSVAVGTTDLLAEIL